jgi:biotin carboxyl carrier protein
MKMETSARAPLSGVVKEVSVTGGTHVMAKDLILIIA